jgi:hypothetical protein
MQGYQLKVSTIFCIDLVYRDSTGTFQRRIDSLCDSYYPCKSLQTSRIESYRNSLSIFDPSVNAALSALARDCFGASFSTFFHVGEWATGQLLPPFHTAF